MILILWIELCVCISDDNETESGETKRQSVNWMAEAEKRMELLKLQVEKEGKDDDSDWDDSDCSDDDFSEEDNSSS